MTEILEQPLTTEWRRLGLSVGEKLGWGEWGRETRVLATESENKGEAGRDGTGRGAALSVVLSWTRRWTVRSSAVALGPVLQIGETWADRGLGSHGDMELLYRECEEKGSLGQNLWHCRESSQRKWGKSIPRRQEVVTGVSLGQGSVKVRTQGAQWLLQQRGLWGSQQEQFQWSSGSRSCSREKG